MFNRRYSIALLFLTLVACVKKPAIEREAADVTNTEVISSVEENIAVELSKVDASIVSSESSAPESKSEVTLDLSVPRESQSEVRDWQSDEGGRYGVESWFDQKSNEDDKRLTLKTKLRMKDGVEFDKNSNLSNYGDSVDGAEMGFEYKTR
jgi:hypothetical protein